MIVEKKYFKQKNGENIIKCICSDGNYFYVLDDVSELLDDFCWRLHPKSNTNNGTYYVQCSIRNSMREKYSLMNSTRRDIELHKLIFFKYLGYYYDVNKFVIDHINSVQFDNIDSNLDLVNKSENSFNTFSQGYQIMRRPDRPIGFHSRIWIDNKNIGASSFSNNIETDLGIKISSGSTSSKLNELDCCRIQYYLEYIISSVYRFDFKLFRRYDLDLLDKERCGELSEDDVINLFLNRYKDNAWYYYRYNLKDLFKLYNISKPDIKLDSEGFLVDNFGNYLNPFMRGNVK